MAKARDGAYRFDVEVAPFPKPAFERRAPRCGPWRTIGTSAKAAASSVFPGVDALLKDVARSAAGCVRRPHSRKRGEKAAGIGAELDVRRLGYSGVTVVGTFSCNRSLTNRI